MFFISSVEGELFTYQKNCFGFVSNCPGAGCKIKLLPNHNGVNFHGKSPATDQIAHLLTFPAAGFCYAETMSERSGALERCQAFIDSNFMKPPPREQRRLLAITISRQAYANSHVIAGELIRLLEGDRGTGAGEWALFDRDLVHRILEDHNLPKAIARYMPEDRDHDFTGAINEILGVHPSLWELFHYTCDTIYKLARVGNVILIGRGAHIITRNLPHVLHVRIIAPFELRVRRAAGQLGISESEARKTLRQDDQARAAYVRSHFDEDPDNPHAYDLILNTGRVGTRQAVQLLQAALHHH